MDKQLFDHMEETRRQAAAPLAARMRPRTIEEFVGQRHFLGPGKLLTRMLQADRLRSLIFYGPPGVGKTSPAMETRRSKGTPTAWLGAGAPKAFSDTTPHNRITPQTVRIPLQPARTVWSWYSSPWPGSCPPSCSFGL